MKYRIHRGFVRHSPECPDRTMGVLDGEDQARIVGELLKKLPKQVMIVIRFPGAVLRVPACGVELEYQETTTQRSNDDDSVS